ncbi:uncharacterized protein LOC118437416 [Folsomia candida]|uniref:uncharacterized protein LOC118437416 n=1 Tax=Folsomia candida TaxID=158441 RepID=UPI001605109E|nr:uncharacterized protein LOC118437416 [Folsomia candida]
MAEKVPGPPTPQIIMKREEYMALLRPCQTCSKMQNQLAELHVELNKSTLAASERERSHQDTVRSLKDQISLLQDTWRSKLSNVETPQTPMYPSPGPVIYYYQALQATIPPPYQYHR